MSVDHGKHVVFLNLGGLGMSEANSILSGD
jgi:hypothetical protein